MIAAVPLWILDALSRPRFASYLTAVEGDAEAAMRLYWWNIEISSAFYGLLHCLEITLRNALHDQLRTHVGCVDWWRVAQLSNDGARKVAAAMRKLAQRGVRPISANDVVAELSFGFWVSLLSRGAAYDRKLWVPTLHNAFPHYTGPRQPLHENFVTMLLLRNRIMHHEPIHHRDLAADRAKIYRLLGYLSPAMAVELEALDRVPGVLARRGDVCAGRLPARL